SPQARRRTGRGGSPTADAAACMTVVYDAGALIAADRSDRRVWAEHRARLELGIPPLTTAPVVAQVSRSGRQAQLRRFLRGCEVVPFSSLEALEIGSLAGRSGTA